MRKHLIRLGTVLIFAPMLATAAAQSPAWGLNEVYSNADGSVQFVVYLTREGGQQHLGGLTLVVYGGGMTHTLVFPRDLPGESAGRTFLIATQGFADLNVLQPDYVVPNGFFPIAGGTISVAGNSYPGHSYHYRPLPTDGARAYWLDEAADWYGAAVATNFAGAQYSFTESPRSSPTPPAIGPGFTGAWFDPAQSGHGLFLEVLSERRILAWWFTFNPVGTEQTWFGGVGTYSGNAATITEVYETTGGRWIPNFDPNRIVNNPWGTLAFTFTDCNHGNVDFNSVAGYGTGSMNLTRLTQPAGLVCP
jgi:hypothetical protein